MSPIPRLLIIVAAVGASIFGITQYMASHPAQTAAAAATTTAPQASPTGQAEPRPTRPEPQATTTTAKPQAGEGRTYQSIVDSGTVRVSVQSPSKPFFYVDKGSPTGFNYDFMSLLFSQSEFSSKGALILLDVGSNIVDTYAAVPEALLKSDNRGKPVVDIAIDGLTFSNEDLPGVVYSIPYVDDFGYALIAPSSTNLKSINDANSMTIGILKGDPDVKAYVSRQWPKATVIELSDASINGERTWIRHFIKSGKVDVVVYDYPFAVAEIAGTDLQFAFSKLPGSDLKYKIGVRKNDRELLDNINTAIRKAKASPDYVILLKKYFMSENQAKARTAAGAETTYVVKVGDTLSTIASNLLGNKMRYSEIESRNNLPNPNLIQVGQKLVIPKS